MMHFLRRFSLGLTLIVVLVIGTRASACPFCGPLGQDATLRNETTQAKLILYGKLTNAQFASDTTDFIIEDVLKPHPILGKKRTITLQRYLPITKEVEKNNRFLVFFDVFRGKLDPYRPVTVDKGSKIVDYVNGLMKLEGKSTSERLKFYFDYLACEEPVISNDAYNEFAFADYKDYKDIAKDLPANTIYDWLKNNPPPYRYGLYASMLGHCSKDHGRDVALLQSLVDDKEKGVTSGLDGILAAIVMIQPKEGWYYLRTLLATNEKPFTRRYAGLRAVRFLYDFRPDLVEKKEMLKGIAVLLDQEDIADLAIEDLRKRKDWDRTESVLGLFDKKSHDIPVVRRSIIRFALDSPKPEAKKFIETQRKKDSELVEDVEELLKLEQPEADSK